MEMPAEKIAVIRKLTQKGFVRITGLPFWHTRFQETQGFRLNQESWGICYVGQRVSIVVATDGEIFACAGAPEEDIIREFCPKGLKGDIIGCFDGLSAALPVPLLRRIRDPFCNPGGLNG